MSKKYHFIAIGGSVMHSLATELKSLGNSITGSDDAIYGNSEAVLKKAGLLPEELGWFPQRITKDLDAVILGMHAKKDNPEIEAAHKLGIPVYSFPDFIYELSKNKQRIVIGGSHGKTSITGMIVHVLNYMKKPVDYLIGAPVKGLPGQVKISDAPVIVIEGDEYLSSPEDPTPKFLKYHHHIGVISGIDWDHANVFPSEKDYLEQFSHFADATPKAGSIIYCEADAEAKKIGSVIREEINSIPYSLPKYKIKNEITHIYSGQNEYPVKVFGEHNLLNMEAAKAVLDKIGITEDEFYEAIQSFEGAGKRLDLIYSSNNLKVYNDFAHSPSKVKATVEAVSAQFPKNQLVAILELHTFSSLNKDFVKRYKGTLKKADRAIIFFDANHKSVDNMISKETIETAFNHPKLSVTTDVNELSELISTISKDQTSILFMSSGQFGGLEITKLFN
ncbi:MAG: Mur ligase family protein [Cyclobacteriaceae bacterium]|nr:Mur ligase family protein [Cyclobacteriaceae bacterium]